MSTLISQDRWISPATSWSTQGEARTDIRRYRVRVAAVEGTYSAVLRPGEADEASVGGLDADSLDAWLSAQGNVADRFTYRFTFRSGSVLVQGEGLIDERGDTAYRLRR